MNVFCIKIPVVVVISIKSRPSPILFPSSTDIKSTMYVHQKKPKTKAAARRSELAVKTPMNSDAEDAMKPKRRYMK